MEVPILDCVFLRHVIQGFEDWERNVRQLCLLIVLEDILYIDILDVLFQDESYHDAKNKI